ncbi:MAG: PQQ-binding-like beta-propeller repeat protein [Candidatus Bathyarchaeota archaeon]|nr:MAG: PQQ-binding-like beta-propeller repeat protein [Candidatus Bathyarchaeota archaeon]
MNQLKIVSMRAVIPFSLVLILLTCITSVPVNVRAHYPSAVITSSGATITPNIDGQFSAGEWDDATPYPLVDAYTAYGYFKNSWDYLYILIDVPTTMPQYSFFRMSFDTGHDEVYTAGHDDDFLITSDGTTYHYVSNGTITPTGGDEFWADYHEHCSPFNPSYLHHDGLEGATGFSTSPNDAESHRIYEFCIPLDLLGLNSWAAERTIGFALSGPQRDGMGAWQWPAHQTAGGSRPLSDYGNLELAYFGVLEGDPFTLLGNFHVRFLVNPPVLNVTVRKSSNIDMESLQISYGSPIDVSGQLIDPGLGGILLLEVETEYIINDEFYELTVHPHTRADDWPMFRHDPSNNAFSTSPAPGTNRTSWATPIGVSPHGVCVAGENTYISTSEGMIVALDALSGDSIWQYQTVGQAPGTPAVSNGVVYIGASNLTSLDYRLYALNASTGLPIWNYTTGGPIASSPTVANGTIYVGANDGLLYALQDSGALLWTYSTGAPIGMSSPTVSDIGVVFIGNLGGKVFALNAKNGAHIWNFTTGGGITTSPATAHGMVYAGSADNNVYGLNASTGVKIWNYTTGDGVPFSSPALGYGNVYVGSLDHNLYALDATTGSHVWNYTTKGDILSSPAVADGKVYLGTSLDDDTVYAFNASTGEVLWTYATGLSSYRASPAVAYGNVYLGTFNKRVYCFGPEHDVAVLDVQLSKTVVGQGYPVNIDIALRNNGDVNEIIHTQVHYNGLIDIYQMAVCAECTATSIIEWNTTEVPKGNYTITATALPIPGEFQISDNTVVDGWVFLTILGDVNGDEIVDISDITMTIAVFGKTNSSYGWLAPTWIVNMDVNDDGIIDITDIVAVIGQFGSSW